MTKNRLKTQETHILTHTSVSIPAPSTLENAKLAQKRAFFVLEKKSVPKKVPYRKRFVKKYLPYKLPTIIRASNGDWVVRYFYEYPDSPGRFKPFAVRDGMNYIHNPEEKEKYARELCSDIKFALEKENYNPFARKLERKRQLTEAKEQRKKAPMTLTAALSWYMLTKKSYGKETKTLKGYRYVVQALIDWYRPNNPRIDTITIDDLERYFNAKRPGWSARSYNNNISAITTFFNYLVAKRKLAVNPIGKGMLETMPNKAEKNKYYDQATLEKILPEIQKKPVLRKFVLWTYYTCARGSELRSLKVKNLDLNIKKITITAETGKTGEHIGRRSIPICQELMDIIVSDGLANLDPDWYIFGKLGKPGPEHCSNSYFSSLYRPIKELLKIDPNYSIYGFKHTRISDLIVAGYQPAEVMIVTGHTDFGGFQAYIRELGVAMESKLTGITGKLNL